MEPGEEKWMTRREARQARRRERIGWITILFILVFMAMMLGYVLLSALIGTKGEG